jgi:hypothetical protein
VCVPVVVSSQSDVIKHTYTHSCLHNDLCALQESRIYAVAKSGMTVSETTTGARGPGPGELPTMLMLERTVWRNLNCTSLFPHEESLPVCGGTLWGLSVLLLMSSYLRGLSNTCAGVIWEALRSSLKRCVRAEPCFLICCDERIGRTHSKTDYNYKSRCIRNISCFLQENHSTLRQDHSLT